MGVDKWIYVLEDVCFRVKLILKFGGERLYSMEVGVCEDLRSGYM